MTEFETMKDRTSDVETLQMVVLALMEGMSERLTQKDRFVLGRDDACSMADDYRLSMMENDTQIVVEVEERVCRVQCDKCKGAGEVDVRSSQVKVDPGPTRCVACGGSGEALHDANKATLSQCGVCGGSGVAPVEEDDD